MHPEYVVSTVSKKTQNSSIRAFSATKYTVRVIDSLRFDLLVTKVVEKKQKRTMVFYHGIQSIKESQNPNSEGHRCIQKMEGVLSKKKLVQNLEVMLFISVGKGKIYPSYHESTYQTTVRFESFRYLPCVYFPSAKHQIPCR